MDELQISRVVSVVVENGYQIQYNDSFVFFADNRSSSGTCPLKNLNDDVNSTGLASAKINVS